MKKKFYFVCKYADFPMKEVFMKKSLCKFFCILSAVLCFSSCSKNSKPKTSIIVSFYNVDSVNKEALKKIMGETAEQQKIKISFNDVNQLPSSTKSKIKSDIVITSAGYSLNQILEFKQEKSALSQEITDGLFQSMKDSVVYKDNDIQALPLFFDNIEINIEKAEYKSSKMKGINSWSDIEDFCKIQKKKTDYPVAFAGAEPVLMLDMLGAFAEGLDGYEAYLKAVDVLNSADKQTFDGLDIARKLLVASDAPLKNTFAFMNNLFKQGYMNPAATKFINRDVNSFAQARRVNVFFTNLSSHRKMEDKTVERYSSIYVPSKSNASNRHFSANITYAVPMNSNETVQNVLADMLSVKKQEELSNATGLAPVLAFCKTPDQQSDDARYWIAATEAPLAGLGHEVEFTVEQQIQLAEAICGLLSH